ncbi:UDP-GLUCURONIC ACID DECARBOXYLASE 2 [Hibiscus trionum]|uniref:UDP-GLUCURONIC ACID DECARBOXYLASE 2 n=1 Tax=Hibiscus trionum TaxID=183268 RepID=A0A9W7M5V6_HIBTR|nr:UDP-GLUCURONIC ACID DECARBOXYLASE 2 [Hibiscus trionum]
MGSELIYRGSETQPASDPYSPKPVKPWTSVTRPIHYLLREQRLLFVFVGIAIASLIFTVFPTSLAQYAAPHGRFTTLIPDSITYFPVETQKKFSSASGSGLPTRRARSR